MRSIQLVAQHRLEERTLPDPPDPKAGELLVKVKAVGLCGSDLHWYLDGRIGANSAVYPQILGHEPLVEVVSAGPGANGFKPGDRVAVEPSIGCGHCEFCLSGFHNNCTTGFFMGGPQAFGFFREYAVIPVINAIPVPAALNDKQATLIEPVAVMAHMLDLVTIRPGDTVAITGAGPIGMLCASVAKASGASRIYICDRVHHRLELAMRMGADIACDIGAFEEMIRDETRGRGVDIAFDASGSPFAINKALAVTRPSGTVMLIGITTDINIGIDIHTAMSKELSILTLKRSNHCSEKAIRMLKSGFINEAVITHSLPLDQTPQAFDMLAEYADGVGKILIYP